MRQTWLVFALALPTLADDAFIEPAGGQGKPPRTVTFALQGGFTSAFQLSLGGVFGPGPDFQDRLSVGVNHFWRKGDNLCVFGWSTTDTVTPRRNWQSGFAYRLPLLDRGRHQLTLAGGSQRWILSGVKTGTQDWLATGALAYKTSVRRLPVTLTQDSYTLLRSNLPTGTVLLSQAAIQHRLPSKHELALTFRHGPQYSYSWGFWGANGHRILRYTFTLAATWKGTTLEASYRPQWGLQSTIPNYNYWSFLITRQWTMPVSKLHHLF